MVAITNKSVRFTVAEYLKMDRAGLFDNRRVELVKGRILRMSPQAHPHRWSVTRVSQALNSRFPVNKFWVLCQSTLYLDKHGAPEPDVHVFAVPGGTEDARLPKPFIVVEVSDKTYKRDSGSKLEQYASAGIEDYWIVNLKERRVEVYRTPKKKDRTSRDFLYTDIKHYEQGMKIKLLAYPKISIAVDELLP